MGILTRLRWLLIDRPKLRAHSSSAQWHCYVCPRTRLGGFNRLTARASIHEATIGRYTYLSGARVGRANVAAFCSIGPGAIVGGLGRHPTSWLSTHPAFYSVRMQAGRTFASRDLFEELLETTVGNDVWIGANAVVLDGVSIGDGAIIAAGAIVNEDVPPFAVVGGVPAKVIRYRFSEEVRRELLDWRWWEQSDELLRVISSEFNTRSDWTASDVQRVRRLCEQAA